MLDRTGFDLWADGYEESVAASDADGAYPFAGYRAVLNRIYQSVLAQPGKAVLELGFGTGTLASRLYARGYDVCGQDFSARMCALAREKLPQALLFEGDFTEGLADELTRRRYDAIVATYALHHLPDAGKVPFLLKLRALLREGGCIYVGDVAFPTRAALEDCRAQAGDAWDEDEAYFVYDELREDLPELTFEWISACAGVLSLRADPNGTISKTGDATKMMPTREQAFALLNTYNQEPFHLRHALTVEGVMRYFARELGYADEEEFWGIVGLTHDLDFERWPEQHCVKCQELMRAEGWDERLIHAVASHGYGLCCDVAPEHQMEKVLFAADELTGLIYAAALMRPSKSVQDMEVKSVKKKFKDKKFAAGCSRDVIRTGAERLGWTLDELIARTLEGMKADEAAINAFFGES